MLQSKSEGPSTFTSLGVGQILHEETDTGQVLWRSQEFFVDSFFETVSSGVLRKQEGPERQMRVRDWCTELQAQIKDHASELEALDMQFSKLLKCHFLPKDAEETIVRSVNLLTRIPETPPELYDPSVDPSYDKLQRHHFLEDSSQVWENLRAARFVSRNTIRMALQIQIAVAGNHSWNEDFQNFLDVTAEVLRTAIDLSNEQPSEEWFVIKAFLWTSWQQAMILYHHYVLEKRLSMQFWPMTSPLDGSDIILRSTERNRNKMEVPSYMCKWALRLLEADQSFMGHDYRRLFQRFSQTFGNCMPRCIISGQSCNGQQPEHCLRLSGMRITNQSAHAYGCPGNCRRLYWNEESWKAFGGAAAVLLDLERDELLNYCESSERTMAVSHVWSHGQGGRPENDAKNEGTGLNSCLHKRYAKIAISHGCDSYWMDTPCIPTNHDLRRKAIKNINRVFENSKLTLVCDKDLMAIDVRNPDLAVQESILATILVCDWNVRAWTLLEALRGRKNIHVLCKDELTVSLGDVIRAVNREGCIDIAVLFLSVQHLLPTPPVIYGIPEDRQHQIQEYDIRPEIGYVTVMEAAGLLSHRHASRPGDEVVIWDLLTGDLLTRDEGDDWDAIWDLVRGGDGDDGADGADGADKDDDPFSAKNFWRKRVGKKIPTGFLMSNIPRLSRVRGFSWAPCRPNFPLLGGEPHIDYDQLLFSYGGEGSEPATITPDGLSGFWWAYVRENSDGQRGLENELWVAFLQPLREMSSVRFQPHPRRSSKHVFATVTSDDRRVWRWKGVLENDEIDECDLSKFSVKGFLIE